MSKFLRHLRIGWAIGCGLACLLFVALWVRSNWHVDEFWIPLPANRAVGFISAANCASVGIQQRNMDPAVYIVGYSHLPLKHFQKPKARSFLGFSAGRDSDVSFVNVPYWFLVLLAAAAPFVRWRFRLRTLMIAMTVVAIGLAYIAFAIGA